MSENNNSGNVGLGVTIFIVFLILKLCKIGQVADWSWWWVTAPLWIPVCLAITILIIGLIISLLTDK